MITNQRNAPRLLMLANFATADTNLGRTLEQTEMTELCMGNAYDNDATLHRRPSREHHCCLNCQDRGQDRL